MSRKMMGVTAVVDEGGRLRGVISDGDLRRLLEKDPGELGRTAGECCRPNPRTVSADEFASGALDVMRNHRITSLFILDGGGALGGALHMHDLLSAGIA
jgi:arabinose-5-phosphate isomerase